MSNRRGGTLHIQVNGQLLEAKGDFEYSLGAPERTDVVGTAAVQGYSEKPGVPYIEGKITDRKGLDVKALQLIDDCTVTMALGNGKTVVLSQAWWSAPSKINTAEGEIDCRFTGKHAEEF